MKLGLREANQHFSRAIKAVRAGKEVILTERGQPIAIIKPVKPAGETEAALEQMVAEGLIALPTRKGPLPRVVAVPTRGVPVSQSIIDDRDDRA